MKRAKSLLAALSVALISATSALAGDGNMIMKESAHSVGVTIDRLAAAVEKAGAKVFIRVDHGAGAAGAGLELGPNQMLMFGRPKMGTPLMQASPSMGLDLPLRVVAFEDADGKVFVAYHDPAKMAKAHGVPTDHPTVLGVTGALDKLTNAATGE
ncbi:MAG: DUF302 domain-containing protein [Pseudomonadota bacterium]